MLNIKVTKKHIFIFIIGIITTLLFIYVIPTKQIFERFVFVVHNLLLSKEKDYARDNIEEYKRGNQNEVVIPKINDSKLSKLSELDNRVKISLEKYNIELSHYNEVQTKTGKERVEQFKKEYALALKMQEQIRKDSLTTEAAIDVSKTSPIAIKP